MMNDRNTPVRKPGNSNSLGLAVATIAICAVLVMGALTVRTPAAATSGNSIERNAADETPTVYFPSLYVNQATTIEPMPPTF